MKRLLIAFLLLGIASAQSAIQMRFGYGEGLGLTFGAGVENVLRQNLAGRLTAELAPAAPGVALEATLLFKPDLGQYDPTLKGLLPYLGGGLSGVVGPNPTLGVGLVAGLEGLLDPTTGLFAEGAYVYGFADFPKVWRFGLGVNFR
ncbi:hypothetical protein GCM10007092_09990 [Thermus composti]|uniref:Outer membrane protein beta-barrel domain-containing protein n=1 Tax=Thermus composti TaxID=532059 RepID=A0ABV6Q1I8_9DEIN|nr:hypothetical protein [Thermus composti]GGM98206.1 hypothetical protein GCM10007092_09990 [Thermus composti]